MLRSAYFLAKIGADTAENEQHFAEILPPPPGAARGPRAPPPPSGAILAQAKAHEGDTDFPARDARGRRRVHGRRRSSTASSTLVFGKISAKYCSFSAVSAPIFARKYAFCSIFQNLPDYLAAIFEIWQNFANFATFAKFSLNFHKNC